MCGKHFLRLIKNENWYNGEGGGVPSGEFSLEWKGWEWRMWGNWVVSCEWVVGVLGAMWVAIIVVTSLCGTFFMGIASSFIGFLRCLIAKKGQGLWASRNEWNNQ